jgi:hypothetical protein
MTVAATLPSTVDDAMVRSFSLFVKGSVGARNPLAGETGGKKRFSVRSSRFEVLKTSNLEPRTSLALDRQKLKHTCQLTGSLQISASQGSAYFIQLLRVRQREIGRPSGVRVNQIHFNFCGVPPFVDQLSVVTAAHDFLLSSNYSGVQAEG